MAKVKKQAIDNFLKAKNIAIAGVSRDKKKFGYKVFELLKKQGYQLAPINPNIEEIDGIKAYSDIMSLPEDFKNLIILTKPDQTDKLVEDAVKRGINNIWIQQMSETVSAIEFAQKNNVNLVYKECVFMHAEPVESIHSFHRFMRKLFGLFPK